jgi:hypothetical protein
VTIYRSQSGLDDLRVVGAGLAHPDTVAAEHWLASQEWKPVVACTHLMQSPTPHVAVSLAFASSDRAGADAAAAASTSDSAPGFAGAGAAAAAAHEARQSGRAVIYPGVELLVGTLSVAEILAVSAITRVEVLGSGSADPAALVETGDFVRPQWRAGELVLTTTPAADDRLVPFETRNPTPCCAAH